MDRGGKYWRGRDLEDAHERVGFECGECGLQRPVVSKGQKKG